MQNIEVTIQSLLASDEPQGRFYLHVSPAVTVETLLRELCKEARTSMKPDYCLRSKNKDVLDRGDTLADCQLHSGAFLHWTSEYVKIRRPSCFNMPCLFWVVAVASLFIGILGLAGTLSLQFSLEFYSMKYAIVFDAGSTHTAMFIYWWNDPKFNGTAIASQYGQKCSVEGGAISNYKYRPEKAGPSLQSCINQAKAIIPVKEHATTPIYMGATAGMRLMQIKSNKSTEAILDSVRLTFAQSGFKFYNPDTSVRILNGSEEGTFSWITSNYVTNAFKVQRLDPDVTEALTIVPTIGAMDLGGASTQITFIPEPGTVMPDNFTQSVMLFGHNYSVYTYSYLCFGVKEMSRRVLAKLVEEQRKNTDIQHPCFPEGYELNQTFADIFSSACNSQTPSVQFPNYTFVGTSQRKECNRIVQSLFSFGKCSSCSFNDAYQPPLTVPFYAFNSFYYVTSFLNLTINTTSGFQHQDLIDATNKFCSYNWAELQLMNFSESTKKFLADYCLQSTYINILLYEGYRFTDQQWPAISFVGKVSGTEVGWALGFLLNESSCLPDAMERIMKTLTFALFLVLFSLSLILGLLLILQLRKKFNTAKIRDSSNGTALKEKDTQEV